MTCYIAPPVETVYILLADSPAVIVTPGNIPILLGTYEASHGDISAPGATGAAVGALSAGNITGPLSAGTAVGALPTGTVEGPKETC